MILEIPILLIVVGTTIWVGADAAGRDWSGPVGFLSARGPWTWMFGCLAMWIVVFPLYLVQRGRVPKKGAVAARPISPGWAPPTFCESCGQRVSPTAKFCPTCGQPVGDAETTSSFALSAPAVAYSAARMSAAKSDSPAQRTSLNGIFIVCVLVIAVVVLAVLFHYHGQHSQTSSSSRALPASTTAAPALTASEASVVAHQLAVAYFAAKAYTVEFTYDNPSFAGFDQAKLASMEPGLERIVGIQEVSAKEITFSEVRHGRIWFATFGINAGLLDTNVPGLH